MTGMEALKEKLLEIGYTKAQVESKVVAGVVSVLAENPKIAEIDVLEKDIEFCKRELDSLRSTKALLLSSVDALEEKREKLYRENEKLRNDQEELIYKANKEYVEKFYNALNECETEEGRDAIKRAQIFVNSVNNNTCYDNTKYIEGLAKILSSGKAAPIEKLEKISQPDNFSKEERW